MNSKQLILTTVAAILTGFSYTLAAEGNHQTPQVNSGYPDYAVIAGPDFNEGRGKYHVQNTQIQSNQGNSGKHGDNGNNGKKAKSHPDKSSINEGAVWYKPWSWRDNNSDSDDDNNRNNQNSNRQSDPDSTRGQERAAERRADKDNPKNDYSWFDPRGWFD